LSILKELEEKQAALTKDIEALKAIRMILDDSLSGSDYKIERIERIMAGISMA